MVCTIHDMSNVGMSKGKCPYNIMIFSCINGKWSSSVIKGLIAMGLDILKDSNIFLWLRRS